MSRQLLRAWVPPIAWLALIFAASSDALSAEHTSRFLLPFLRWLNPEIAPETVRAVHFLVRKVGHLTEYGVLAALLWRAVRIAQWQRTRAAVVSVAVAALFAALDEFHQSFVPTRTATLQDVLIDWAGATIAIALCLFVTRTRESKIENRESP